MREPGFYWVKIPTNKVIIHDNWEIAWFDGDGWSPTYPHDDNLNDNQLIEIDERRIVRQPQCKDNSLEGAKIIGFIKEK